MAYNISEANAVSTKYFDETMKESVYDASPFLSLIKSKNKIKIDGGTSIQFPVRLDPLGTARKTGPRAQVPFQSKETRTAGALDWAYYDAVTVSHWDERIYNSGKAKIVNLLADKAKELSEDMADLLATTLWGTDTSGLIPIPTIVDASDTYAGITVASNSRWAAIEDSSSTVLTLNLLRHARNQATFGKGMPTHHFTTRDLFSKLESLLEARERLENKDFQEIGYMSLSLYGAGVVADPFISAGDWFGLNMKEFELFMREELKASDWFTLEQAGYPNAMAKYLSGVMQLVCHERRTSFKFTALDYTL